MKERSAFCHRILVILLRAADDGKVPVIKRLVFSDQRPNRAKYTGNFLLSGERNAQMQGGRLPRKGLERVAEKTCFQKGKGRIIRKTHHRIPKKQPVDSPPFSQLSLCLQKPVQIRRMRKVGFSLRQPLRLFQLKNRLFTQVKKVLLLHPFTEGIQIFLRRNRDRTNHLAASRHQCPKQPILHRSKAGKSVKGNHGIF